MLQADLKANSGHFALITLGSNANSPFGNATETVQKAMQLVSERLGGPAIFSPLYETPAFPAGAGPNFTNAAIRVETTENAPDILEKLHQIEAMADRKREVRWGQRTLDLDLIAVGDQVYPNVQTHQKWVDLPANAQAELAPDQLILPHPRLQDRSFVLVPLADVAPDWTHPVSGQTVQHMLDARPTSERGSVLRLDVA